MFDLTYKGMRVPWAVEWSEEVLPGERQAFQYEPLAGKIMFADEKPEDRVRIETPNGVKDILWMRTGMLMGGEPRYAKLNTHRQARCMLDNLCQVCGLNAGNSWLMPPNEPARSGERLHTTTPPTCEPCVEVARAQCPIVRSPTMPPPPGGLHWTGQGGWRQGGDWLTVRDYRVFAIWGDIFDPAARRLRQGEMPLSDERGIRHTLGRQLTVEIYGWRKHK